MDDHQHAHHEPPRRIPARGGDEQDVFSRWRAMLCYTQRAGVCANAKRSYNRRLRRVVRGVLADVG